MQTTGSRREVVITVIPDEARSKRPMDLHFTSRTEIGQLIEELYRSLPELPDDGYVITLPRGEHPYPDDGRCPECGQLICDCDADMGEDPTDSIADGTACCNAVYATAGNPDDARYCDLGEGHPGAHSYEPVIVDEDVRVSSPDEPRDAAGLPAGTPLMCPATKVNPCQRLQGHHGPHRDRNGSEWGDPADDDDAPSACTRPRCGHAAAAHAADDEENADGPCLFTGCACEQYQDDRQGATVHELRAVAR